MGIDINVSNTMKIAKVLAILTVIMAHSRNGDYEFIGIITERIGAVGVPVFFFIAGYYFKVGSEITKFWKKKVITVILPWIFTGSLLFLNRCIKLGFSNFSILKLFNWLLGNGTYLWYLTILILCYAFFSYAKSKPILVTFIAINVISLLMTSFGILDLLANKVGFQINNYLNIFNWLGYFSLGILAKGRMEVILSFLKSKILIILLGYPLLLVVGYLIEPNTGGYFSKLAIPMELAGIIYIFALSSLYIFNKNIIYTISELTFSIYLTHFMVFSIRRFLLENPVFEFINPIIILAVNTCLLLFFWKISSLLKLDKIYTTLLGIRNTKNNTKIEKNITLEKKYQTNRHC